MAYRGLTAPLPIGRQGFNGSKNPSQLQPGHLAFADGVQLDSGVIEKEGGAVKLNATALASGAKVLAGISIDHPSETHDLVFLGDGTVRHDDGTGAFETTLKTGLTPFEDTPPVFVQAGGEDVGQGPKTFLFSRPNQVQVITSHTADSMANISDPPADWSDGNFPSFGVHHDNRLWGGGNLNDPHRIYFSSLADHQDFLPASGGGTLPVFPGEGQGIVAGISFRGLLILWKYPVGIYFVDTRGVSTSDWMVRRLSDSVGGLNQVSIVQIENDIMYLDQGGGMHLLSATSELGDINTSNISHLADLGPFMRSDVNLSQISRACAVWYAAKRQAWYAMPGRGETENTLRFMIDFNDPQSGPRFLPSRRDVSKSMWMRRDDDGVARPTIGDDEGFIWKLDQEGRHKDGSSYDMRFRTADIDFSFLEGELGTKAKNGQFLEVVSESMGDWQLVVDVFWDDIYVQTILFSMGSGGSVLGSFELDVDALGAVGVVSNRRRLIGSGRRVQFQVQNSGLNQNVALAEFHIGFSVSDERSRNAP